MAHHWADYSADFHESEQKLRLDPCHLPQTVCYKGKQSGKYFHVSLSERGIFLRETALPQKPARGSARHHIAPRALHSASLAQSKNTARKQQTNEVLKILSPRLFRGVAACKITLNQNTPQEQKAFCLMLLHDEADYCIPLLISACKDDVLLDWRLWADSYNLPMLIGEEGRGFRPLGGGAALKLFINDHKMRPPQRDFSLRCHGLSLNTRLVLSNQVMLG